jgi:2-amino-4-hydroxy-6-hydroxymethyldihydropteridine diphosphokinase
MRQQNRQPEITAVRVLIGLGSNEGDSAAIISRALIELRAFADGGRLRASRLWRTTPVDCPPGSRDFINAVAAFEPGPGLTPDSLIVALKVLEHAFGRRAGARNAPRVLDLDLLVYGDEVREGPDLVLPHPRAATRRFVLVPAAEVAPDLIWPNTGRTVSELAAGIDSTEVVTALEAPV